MIVKTRGGLAPDTRWHRKLGLWRWALGLRSLSGGWHVPRLEPGGDMGGAWRDGAASALHGSLNGFRACQSATHRLTPGPMLPACGWVG